MGRLNSEFSRKKKPQGAQLIAGCFVIMYRSVEVCVNAVFIMKRNFTDMEYCFSRFELVVVSLQLITFQRESSTLVDFFLE